MDKAMGILYLKMAAIVMVWVNMHTPITTQDSQTVQTQVQQFRRGRNAFHACYKTSCTPEWL